MARTTFKNDLMVTGGTYRTVGAATAAAGAATLSAHQGKITTEALTTAQNLFYTLTITNTKVAAADIVMASLQNGTSTTGTPVITDITVSANTIVIRVQNMHASAEALNGTLVIAFTVMKAA